MEVSRVWTIYLRQPPQYNTMRNEKAGGRMTRLWRINQGYLTRIPTSSPKTERMVEDWVANDPEILALDLLIIGRQCQTEFGSRADLLGIDRNGDLTLIELKREQTPRDVVAQTLDYGSWVRNLTTPQIHRIANDYLGRPLSEAFKERFSQNIPEALNTNHNLLIVASNFDPSSRRIVEYLAEAHGVSINTAFFSHFQDGQSEFLAANFLMDQQQVIERSEAKTKPPWTGYYYVNAGHDPVVRSWEDMRLYGFIAAGYGRIYSGRLEQLSEGDHIFVYQKAAGYIGYGMVTSAAVKSKDFQLSDGRYLAEVDLRQPGVLHDAQDEEHTDYIVGVEWKCTFPLNEAKWFSGAFANQNVVCKLRDPATLDFLYEKFGV